MWRLQGRKAESAQYIGDGDGKLVRKLEDIHERWKLYSASLLNATSAALNQAIVAGISPKSIALSLVDPPVVDEVNYNL